VYVRYDGLPVPFSSGELSYSVYQVSPVVTVSVVNKSLSVYIVLPPAIARDAAKVSLVRLDGQEIASITDQAELLSGKVSLSVPAVPGYYLVKLWRKDGSSATIGSAVVVPSSVDVVGSKLCIGGAATDDESVKVLYAPPGGQLEENSGLTKQLRSGGCVDISKLGRYIAMLGGLRLGVCTLGVKVQDGKIVAYDTEEHVLRCIFGCSGGHSGMYFSVPLSRLAPVVRFELDGETRSVANPLLVFLAAAASSGAVNLTFLKKNDRR